MIKILKIILLPILTIRMLFKSFFSVNWTKTLYFNFKMFPFEIAKKLPVYFYGPVRFSGLSGNVIIDAPIKKAMIGFGQRYEKSTKAKGVAELGINGKVIFKGHVQFGKDYLLIVAENAVSEFGHMSSIGSDGYYICTNRITFGNFARVGSEARIIDTNFHQMLNTVTREKYPMSYPIEIGNYNFIGFRVSIMSKTKTPDYCTVASNTVCNRDYSELGNNILIGGIPAKLLKKNISRDWQGEHEMLMKNLIVN